MLSFKLTKYVKCDHIFNIVKNVNDKSMNKLIAFKLITYNEKILTNNMIKSKCTKYSCLYIGNVDIQIILNL